MIAEPPDATFRRHLADGRFMLQRSQSTGGAIHPPRLMNPGDGADDLTWFEPSGHGTIHSFTVVPQRTPKSDYNICLIDLAEGVRIVSRVDGAEAEDLSIGAEVVVAIDTIDGSPVVVFRLACAA